MNNLINDLSTLTTIPVSTLDRLVQKSVACICHNVEEGLASTEMATRMNIGIGTLSILVTDEEVKYKFIPSPKLEDNIKETVITGESPLIVNTEEMLKDKVMNVYKELF